MRIENSNTTSHHNPSRYMVDEPRPSQARLQGATDTVTSSSMNNYAPPHPEKLTWEGSRTDTIIIGKITGEGTFEHVPQGKALQLRIEIKTEPKGATTREMLLKYRVKQSASVFFFFWHYEVVPLACRKSRK